MADISKISRSAPLPPPERKKRAVSKALPLSTPPLSTKIEQIAGLLREEVRPLIGRVKKGKPSFP